MQFAGVRVARDTSKAFAMPWEVCFNVAYPPSAVRTDARPVEIMTSDGEMLAMGFGEWTILSNAEVKVSFTADENYHITVNGENVTARFKEVK